MVIIQNGKNGYFFETNNSNSLTNLLENIDITKINKNTLISSAKKYSGNKISNNLIKIYKSIIHKSNKTNKFTNIK